MTSHLQIAEQTLLAPHGLASRQLDGIFGQLFGHHIDYADLYFQYARSEAWSLEEGIVKSGTFNIEQGVGVRAISGEKTAFAYSDDISHSALKAAAATTRAIAAAGAPRLVPLLRKAACQTPLYVADDPIASLDATQKVNLLERLEALARAEDTRVKEVMAHVAGTWEVILVARSDGHLAADVRPLVRVSITVIMEDEVGGVKRREQGSSGGGGRSDYSYYSDDQLKTYAHRQAK